MGYDTGLAKRLRQFDLRVIECDGWQSRGSSSFSPQGAVTHHTADGPNGNIPSLDVLINGREGLSGPLCNVAMARDGTAYIVAAGRANHAGEGGWRGLTGNSSVWGLECENVGTSKEPWTEMQQDAMARIQAAVISNSSCGAGMVCFHKEWAPNRKPDCHTLDGGNHRSRIELHLDVPPLPPTPEEVPLFCLVQPDDDSGIYRFNGAEMIGVPNMDMLGGDQILLASLGLDNQVRGVSKEWFDTWPRRNV